MIDEKWLQEVQDSLRTKFEDEGLGELRFVELVKMGDVHLHGVSVFRDDQKAVPTFYLEQHQEQSVEAAVEEIFRELTTECTYGEAIPEDFCKFLNDTFSDRLSVRLLNLENNKEYLQDKPYREFLDLALVPYLDYDAYSVVVTDKILESMKVSAEESIELALRNVQSKYSVECCDIVSVLRKMVSATEFGAFVSETFGSEVSESEMFVIVDEDTRKATGPLDMLFCRELQKLSEQLSSDLYVLPSSIYEIICVPFREEIDPTSLREIVLSVNKECVVLGEQLSNRVYKYSRDTNKVSIVC